MNFFVFTVFGVFRSRSCQILGFRREVDENSVLMGYYTASIDNFLPTFRDYRSHLQWPREITNTRCVTTQKSSNLFERFLSIQNTSRFHSLGSKCYSVEAAAYANRRRCRHDFYKIKYNV